MTINPNIAQRHNGAPSDQPTLRKPFQPHTAKKKPPCTLHANVTHSVGVSALQGQKLQIPRSRYAYPEHPYDNERFAAPTERQGWEGGGVWPARTFFSL